MPLRSMPADLVARITPRGFLQAVEYEEEGRGSLRAMDKSVVYVDKLTGARLLTLSYATHREAEMQVDFLRLAYADMRSRRAALRVIEGGAHAA